jgi:iron complex transport system ATP-binding protein
MGSQDERTAAAGTGPDVADAPTPQGEAPLIELDDAVVVRDGAPILRVDSLAFRRGEHVALLGPNGAGKSTLIGLVTRDVRPEWRSRPPVLLQGRARWDLFEARRVFGVVSDAIQAEHTRPVTVLDTVLSGFFGSVGLYRRADVTGPMLASAERLLDFLGIAHLAARTMDTLSTGEARRALIGRALIHEPALLVLDEPTHGLDPGAAYHFLALLRRIAAEGRTLLLVTHHVDDIIPEVERVVLLKAGSVVADGPKGTLLTSERLSELYGRPAHLEERDGWFRLW